MPRPFKGDIKLDMPESKADWDAFLENKSPKDAPNVLVILYDDGCAAWSPLRRRRIESGGRVPHDDGPLFTLRRGPAAPSRSRRAVVDFETPHAPAA